MKINQGLARFWDLLKLGFRQMPFSIKFTVIAIYLLSILCLTAALILYMLGDSALNQIAARIAEDSIIMLCLLTVPIVLGVLRFQFRSKKDG